MHTDNKSSSPLSLHPETFGRTEMLIGTEALERLSRAHVLIIGLGGVGGYAAEILTRSGVGELTLVDADTVQPTNINRQLIATQATIGLSKAELWHARLLEINPSLRLHMHPLFVRDELTEQLLAASPYDFAIDAIDTLSPKVHLIKALQEHGIPFVSSMGAAAKSDPREIKIGRMDKVINCTLARMIRKKLRHLGASTHFTVVYSTEFPCREATIETEGEQNKKSVSGTVAYMPAIFGCFAAYAAIDHLRTTE